jgi:multimeric flavodoxin WrbA
MTPVNWYQVPRVLKAMIDRLVCADGGNPDLAHHLVSAGNPREPDRHVGNFEPGATSHDGDVRPK